MEPGAETPSIGDAEPSRPPVSRHRSGRPRIVHVINSLNVGGAETQLSRLVAVGQAGPFQHVVLPLMEGGAITARVQAAGALAAPLGVESPADLATAPGRLARRLLRLRPDLVHGWLLQGNLAATIATGLARLDVPVLWNIRWALYDLESERLRTRMLLRLSALLSRRPLYTVYNSRTAVPQHVAIGFPAERARVIPNGFDVMRFRPDPDARTAVRAELGIADQTKVVGMLARYHETKNHAMSLHAAARVIELGCDAVFVYAGRDVDEANEELMPLVRKLGLTERVRLLGERQDAAELYPAFDVYWLSSWARGIAEGFPNVVAEAMACAVPCVVTDVGDAGYAVGETGTVVPPGDSEALADAVVALLEEGPERLRQRGSDARARIERDFSLASVAGAYADLYAEALART